MDRSRGDKTVKQRRALISRRPGKPAVAEQQPKCPHARRQWLIGTAKSTATYPDGAKRDDALRGGKLKPADWRCVAELGHDGPHRDVYNTVWA